MTREQTLKQHAAGHSRVHHHSSRKGRSWRSAVAHPLSRQERLFFALLGGCLGLTLVASAMLRLVAG